MATTKEYLIKTVYDSAGLKKFTSDVEQAQNQAKLMGLTLSQSAKVIDQSVATSFNKAGKAVRDVTTVFEQNGKTAKVSFQQVEGQAGLTSRQLTTFGASAAKAEIDLGKLISRALVTIPVWFALRAAITGVMFGIRDGFQNIISLDAAMQKLRGNLSGSATEIASTMKDLKQEFTDLSLKTGVSTDEIANAFQKFATVGFGVKESLTGAVGATKLAIAFFGDSTETANAFARGLRVLVDQSHGVASSQQQISEAMALTAELWQKNAFEIGEMNQGLEKFAAVAQTSKISMKETLVLLATMGTAAVGGARGGTLLRTSLSNLVQHIGEVSKQLGVQVNPQFDTTFTVLTKVIDALSKLDANSALVIERTGAMAKIFGGVRGSLPIQALTAMNDLLKENMKYTGDVGALNKRVDEVLASESGQAKILGNNMRELGKLFVNSAVGGENFAESLKKINDFVNNSLSPTLEKVGVTIRNLFNTSFKVDTSVDEVDMRRSEKKFQDFHLRLVKALRGEMTGTELAAFKIDFGNIKSVESVNEAKMMPFIKAALEKALSKEQVAAKLGDKAKVELTPGLSSQPTAIRSLENELAELKARLKAKGATDIQLELLDVEFLKSQAVVDANKVRDEQSKIRVQTFERERSIQNELLKAVEDGAKAEGASNLEAIVRRIELEKQLGIEKNGMELLTEQLDLQRALTEETKKTREERLKALAALISKTASPFASNNNLGLETREQNLRMQASFKGISDEQVNKILKPEESVAKNGLLRDLQNGLANPMTKSMGSLESAISDLTQTLIQQETRPLDTSVPRWPTPTQKKSAADFQKELEKQMNDPNSYLNQNG